MKIFSCVFAVLLLLGSQTIAAQELEAYVGFFERLQILLVQDQEVQIVKKYTLILSLFFLYYSYLVKGMILGVGQYKEVDVFDNIVEKKRFVPRYVIFFIPPLVSLAWIVHRSFIADFYYNDKYEIFFRVSNDYFQAMGCLVFVGIVTYFLDIVFDQHLESVKYSKIM